MENLDKILARIADDAQEKKRVILEKADDVCRELNAEADEKIEKIVNEAKLKSQKNDSDIMTRAESSAAMQKRSALLKAKVDTVDRAYKAAENYLYSLPEDQYRELLSQLLANAVANRLAEISHLTAMYGETEAAEKNDFVVFFNQNDLKKHATAVVTRAKKLLSEKSPDWKQIKISKGAEPIDIRGGLSLQYGDIESNCSFSALISASRASTENAVAEVLFGKSDEK